MLIVSPGLVLVLVLVLGAVRLFAFQKLGIYAPI
jgi:hypothetical protein